MSGAISTDPFEFYEKLYRKQNTNVNSEEANSFLNNPNLLRVNEKLSESCEGEITLKECETILLFFKTGKTPGNDGIPVEFYRVFWPLLGKLVESFNEAYNKKGNVSLLKAEIIWKNGDQYP